jgi:hypothetical protein
MVGLALCSCATPHPVNDAQGAILVAQRTCSPLISPLTMKKRQYALRDEQARLLGDHWRAELVGDHWHVVGDFGGAPLVVEIPAGFLGHRLDFEKSCAFITLE